jgi:hypothetical protein
MMRSMLPTQAPDQPPDKPPYFKFAFANPYNLSLLVGGLAAAAVLTSPITAIVAVGAEVLWLLHGPDSRLLRKTVWDPKFAKILDEARNRERANKIASLDREETTRVQRLISKNYEISKLASSNPTFTGELLRSELGKAAALVDSFIDMAVTCNRYEDYLEHLDIKHLERDREMYTSRAQQGTAGDPQTQIAKKNLAVIIKRIDKLREIKNYVTVARGELDLIENTFQLIADQIVTMQSPQELSGQLDDLLSGVEAVRETAIDTESLMATVER